MSLLRAILFNIVSNFDFPATCAPVWKPWFCAVLEAGLFRLNCSNSCTCLAFFIVIPDSVPDCVDAGVGVRVGMGAAIQPIVPLQPPRAAWWQLVCGFL